LQPPRASRIVTRAAADSVDPADFGVVLAFDRDEVARLEALVAWAPREEAAAVARLTGRELRTLLTAKWGRPWALRVATCTVGQRDVVALHVDARCDDNHDSHDRVAALLCGWRGAADCVRRAILEHPDAGARAVPLCVSLDTVVRRSPAATVGPPGIGV
jgi:hypothetical protein